MREYIKNLHPWHIVVTKEGLKEQLIARSDSEKLILRPLAVGRDHLRFEEWLVKACYRLQLISSFVYLARNKDNGSPSRRKLAKLPVKQYETWIFDGHCENLAECKELLTRIYQEEGLPLDELSDEFVGRMFEKFCAVKRYALPMLTNTLEYEFFSFYRYILLYVAEHDTYPEFPVSSFFQYPLMPGMCECEVDLDYC